MAFGIIVYDLDRNIVAIDEAAAAIFEKPSHELLGRSLYDFVPKPDRQQMAEARATFERTGEASAQYALERDDGSRASIMYSVLANAPMTGLNLMALGASDAEVEPDSIRLRRVGQDVYPGTKANDEARWFGTDQRRRPGAPPAPEIDASTDLTVAVFPTEDDAWAALLALQPMITAPQEIALTSFDGGWPRDQRSVLAVRGVDAKLATIATILEDLGGLLVPSRMRLVPMADPS
jgi:PAS domain-containing protein